MKNFYENLLWLCVEEIKTHMDDNTLKEFYSSERYKDINTICVIPKVSELVNKNLEALTSANNNTKQKIESLANDIQRDLKLKRPSTDKVSWLKHDEKQTQKLSYEYEYHALSKVIDIYKTLYQINLSKKIAEKFGDLK